MILALPHAGNWEAAGVWLLDHGYPLTTVAERLKPESLYERFVAYRESLGMEILPLTGGGRSPSDVLKDRLREGDRVVACSPTGISPSAASTSSSSATRPDAGRPGAAGGEHRRAALPVGTWFTPGGWGIRIHPEVPIAEDGRLRDKVTTATQQLADAFAQDIAVRPHDWHMLQRLWLSDLPAVARPGPDEPSGAG